MTTHEQHPDGLLSDKDAFNYFYETTAVSDQEIFGMWAESYGESSEIMSSNQMQAAKAKRDYIDYRAKMLKDDFMTEHDIDIALDEIKRILDSRG